MSTRSSSSGRPGQRRVKRSSIGRTHRQQQPQVLRSPAPPGVGYLVVDGDTASPTSRVIHAFDDDPDTLVAATSVGALVIHWTELLEEGHYRCENGEWTSIDGPRTFPGA